MKTLFYLSASPRGERSHSRTMGNHFLRQFLAARPDWRVDELDLSQHSLPELDATLVSARMKISAGEELDEGERAAWEAVKLEFRRFAASDFYLISTPLWNFGLPYSLKHYIDFITQPGIAFGSRDHKASHGVLEGRRMAVVYATGAPESDERGDLIKRHLENWAEFVGIHVSCFRHSPYEAGSRERCEMAIDSYLEDLVLP